MHLLCYKTLTLEIDGQKQNLYYGEDGAWYSALSDDGLLLDENKVAGNDVKFNIPSAPTWIVTFKRNTPAGAIDSEITITSESVEVKPELILSDDSYIDKATGKVSVDSIDGDKVVTGTYPPKAIGQSVTASSTNSNYEFTGWTANGVTINENDIADHQVNGNTEVFANWNNISSFKVLTIKDGDVVKEKAYFNTDDSKWYNSNITTSGEKTSVAPLSNRLYEIAFNNGDRTTYTSIPTSFLGYGVDGNTDPVIRTYGSLSGYTIDKDTVLVSLWSEVTIPEPSEQPTKDGYTFEAWYNGESLYSFDSVVTGNMTLTAHWTKKTFNTLTFDITGLESPVATQTLYYGSDGAWYKALGEGDLLLDDNKVTGDVKFNIPEAPTWTVTFKKNPISGMNDSEITISSESVEVKPELSLSPNTFIDKATGKVLASSISEHITVTGTYPPTAIVESVTASYPNVNYEFEKWTANGEDIVDIANHQVNGNTEVLANWKNLSDFKVLTVKDGDVTKDTAYYNIKDGKWYVSNDITSGLKTSVAIPETTQKTYIATINYDNGSGGQRISAASSFSGYCDVTGKQVLKNNGSLKVEHEDGYLIDYTISSDTTLFAKWSEAKFNRLAQPAKDGYTFNGWYNGENPYDFNSVVTEDITLTARWTQKTFKTLTLDIGGQEQKLYYGSDDAWYKALSVGGLLLTKNKVTGEDVKFNIPSAPTWTVIFNKNIPEGTSYSEFEISSRSVEVHPELSLSPDTFIDKATGKVFEESRISENITVTGTYPPTAIVESVTASSTNVNYEFEKWTANGEDITDIANYAVSGNTEIVANWKNISDFKKLTVKDGDVVKDTVYYNATDNMWYGSKDITSEIKRSVNLPQVKKKAYTITLNYDNGTLNGSTIVTSSFLGYGIDGNTSAVIGTNGSLYTIQTDGSISFYTIDKDTELVSLWSEVKFNKPVQPTKDGYVFNGWYKDGKPYDFNSVVTWAITLTAHWTPKTFNTLTLNIGGEQQKLYYGEDGSWYKALSDKGLLLNDNKATVDEVKFTIPKYVRTVYFNKNTPAGAIDSEISISHDYVEVHPELSLSDDSYVNKTTGKVLVSSISEDKTVTGTYPPTAIGHIVTASSTNVNYEFEKWTANGEDITDIFTYKVNGPVVIDANWNCLADFKSLTIYKDENSTESSCTVYFNKTDKKWYASKDLNIDNIITSITRPDNIFEKLNRNINFYANNTNGDWTTNQYTLKFEGYGEIIYPQNTTAYRRKRIYANGYLGDLEINTDTVYYAYYGGTFGSLPTYTNEGKTFAGWYIAGNAWFKKDPATPRQIKTTDDIPTLPGVSCYARWI